MNRGDTQKKKVIKGIIAVLFAAAVVIFALVWVFQNFISSYKDNITAESASHLVEISHQVSAYIEENIESDWKAAESMVNNLRAHQQDEFDDLLATIRGQQDIWGISDVVIHLEDGHCVNADGDIVHMAESAGPVHNAKNRGRYMTIEQSTVIYTIPLETPLTIKGTQVIGISVARNLDSFIDEMEFSSFDGSAFMYLAESGGTKISQLTHPNAPEVDNLYTLFDGMECSCLTQEGYTVADTMVTEEISTFLCKKGSEAWYVVLMPVKTEGTLWQLCYWAPERVVNATMDSFTSSVIGLSAAIIVLFAICALAAFSLIYKERRKQFDGALMARDRLFNQLTENTQIAFALHSTQQEEPLYCSANVEKIIGYPYLQLVMDGQQYQLVIPRGFTRQPIELVNKKLAEWNGTDSFISDYIPYAVEGFARYYVLRLYPTENEAEFVGIAQDVTKEREREEALKTALAMADSANLAKTRFLANMSHDVRTPMNAIMNMTRFIMENADEPEKHEDYLKTILDSSAHLLQIINDILDMSRIESGQTVIAAEPFELSKTLNEVCEMMRPLYLAKQQSFTMDFSGVQSNRLVGDRLKLSQILINLLNNAMKFTPAGGWIHFVAEEMDSLRSEIAAFRFIVEDNGIGIAPEQILELFKPFARADHSKVGNIEGTGLGLSICKSYVTAMGGTIVCGSDAGAGSIFTVELSFERNSRQSSYTSPQIEEAAVTFENRRALLCEDNEINQIIASKILERLGFDVEIAGDGAEAVEKFLSSKPGHYDVIYMDIQMPKMNGYEAAAAIRASGHPQAGSVPIIAMTANVYAEDAEKSRASGMNGHIGKPVVVKDLIYATGKAFKAKTENTPRPK